MRILVAVEPVDFRKGIDGLAGVCRETLRQDPFSGYVFVFGNRRRKAVKILVYNGEGFWLCQKRPSMGRFRWWPQNPAAATEVLEAYLFPVLLSGGGPVVAKGAPARRRVDSSERKKPLCSPPSPRILWSVAILLIYRWRAVTQEDAAFIRDLIAQRPTASRREFPRESH